MQNRSYENEFDLHENEPVGETHFHVNGFTRRLVLTQRLKSIEKCPYKIRGVFHLQKNSEIFHWEFPFGKARSICQKSHSWEAWPLNRPRKAWNW